MTTWENAEVRWQKCATTKEGEGSLTLGDLYVQGCPDQSHEGGVKVHRVVIGNRQVHAEQPLWRASQGESMRQAVPQQTCRSCISRRGGGVRGRGQG